MLFRSCLLLAAHAVLLAQPKIMSWTVDGVKREAIVYGPKSTGARVPVVLAFHGHGDTNVNFAGVELHEAWPGAIVVYPQGLPASRDGLSGWQTESGMDRDRDLKLVDEILVSLHKAFKVDDSRIYATGFSNGGDRKSTRLNSSHIPLSRMPSSA